MQARLRVLITRPAAQSAQIEALLRRHGAQVVALPLFEIQSAGDAASHARLLDTARNWDGWLFTSANAARETARLDAGAWPTLYAIGEATARVLAELGHPGARHATTGNTSEHLLAQADLQRVDGKRFLLCTGQGGRDLLAPGLQARGAHVQRVEVYRRVAIDHPAAAVRAAAAGSDAIVCTSGESLERLHQLLPNDLRSAVTSRLLVVPSPRVLELARRLGFAEVRAPQRTSDESLVECLFPPA